MPRWRLSRGRNAPYTGRRRLGRVGRGRHRRSPVAGRFGPRRLGHVQMKIPARPRAVTPFVR